MARVVPLMDVGYRTVTPTSWEVKRMRQVLERQGQIEPLQVYRHLDGGLCTFKQDPWGAALVQAARELQWPTLLIVEVRRYQ